MTIQLVRKRESERGKNSISFAQNHWAILGQISPSSVAKLASARQKLLKMSERPALVVGCAAATTMGSLVSHTRAASGRDWTSRNCGAQARSCCAAMRFARQTTRKQVVVWRPESERSHSVSLGRGNSSNGTRNGIGARSFGSNVMTTPRRRRRRKTISQMSHTGTTLEPPKV